MTVQWWVYVDLGSTVVRQSLIPRRCIDISLYCHNLSRRGFILSSGTGNAFSTTSKVVLGYTQCIVSNKELLLFLGN